MERTNSNEKKTILLIILFTLLVSVAAYSFAHFLIEGNKDKVLSLDIETEDIKRLIFDKGDAISIYIDIVNFYEGAGDESDSTSPSVTLLSNDEFTDYYSIALNIFDNSIIYSTLDEIPELILNVYDEEGIEVTEIEGLTYVIDEDISGFDVTDKDGKYVIAIDKEIYNSGGSEVIHEWTFTITFRNLADVQNMNLGGIFDAGVCLSETLDECEWGRLKYYILSNNGETHEIEDKGSPNFSTVATTNEGMYAIEDNEGTSYYFRGAVDNNWVKFAGFYWRIIRIEGTGAIKLIYSGTTAPTSSQSTIITGTGTQIGTSAFISSSSSTVHTGYVYQTGVLHGKTTNSTIKTAVDTWYNNNLSSYSSYLATSNYCVDRVVYDRSGSQGSYVYTKSASQVVSTSVHYYGAASRLYYVANESPSLECEDSGDVLPLKVGLISADEVSIAGGLVGTNNTSYYLYTNNMYWTLSPYYFNGFTGAYTFSVNTSGSLGDHYVTNTWGGRPTISLLSNISISKGDGTWGNPYVIE